MKTININGKDYTVEELTSILENAKTISPMDKVFAYHNTTEEEFNKLYKKLPKATKYTEIEAMIVAYKNQGWTPDWNNSNEPKYFPYFTMGSSFGFYDCYFWFAGSYVGSRFCFKSLELLKEAVEEFLPQYKLSRLTH